MHDLEQMYRSLKEKYPNFEKMVFKRFMEDMPAEAYVTMLFFDNDEKEDYHLENEDQYKCAVKLLEWIDEKGHGEKWAVDEIARLANINFAEKDYTKYDFAYIMNMLFSDNNNVFNEPMYYLKMSKNYLEDPDYMGEASERAYINARKRIKYFKENN
jgi:hypothetical protein